jgi:O-antigen ligase
MLVVPAARGVAIVIGITVVVVAAPVAVFMFASVAMAVAVIVIVVAVVLVVTAPVILGERDCGRERQRKNGDSSGAKPSLG